MYEAMYKIWPKVDGTRKSYLSIIGDDDGTKEDDSNNPVTSWINQVSQTNIASQWALRENMQS